MPTMIHDRVSVPEPTPKTHRALADLEKGLAALPPRPAEVGEVVLLCSRLDGNVRWLPSSMSLDAATGFPEDRWHRNRAEGESKYKDLYAGMQVATMEAPIADLIANGQPRYLFGDNLFLELDLSTSNLPTGSRLRIGEATLEVTPVPHNGCKKFHARFGADALRFVAHKERRPLNLRGLYLRIIEGGRVAVGDRVTVLSRLEA